MYIKIRTLETDPLGARMPDGDGYLNTDLVTHLLADEVDGESVTHVYLSGGRVTVLAKIETLVSMAVAGGATRVPR